MVLKAAFLITVILFSAQGYARPNSEQIELELTLPKATKVKASFYARTQDELTVFSPDRKFLGNEGAVWLDRVNQNLESAYDYYVRAIAATPLPFCAAPFAKRPPTRIVFYNFKNESGEDSRAGYYHPDNAAIVIQDRFWDSASVMFLAIHEAVHDWCLHAPYKSRTEHWLEEGLADWVAYKTSGMLEQRTITRYFDEPCQPTLYGSSFLWWLSHDLSNGQPQNQLTNLASLHLGLRADIVFGKLSPSDCNDHGDNATPFATLTTTTAENSIPIWERPNRQPSLRAPRPDSKPTRYFRWNGP